MVRYDGQDLRIPWFQAKEEEVGRIETQTVGITFNISKQQGFQNILMRKFRLHPEGCIPSVEKIRWATEVTLSS